MMRNCDTGFAPFIFTRAQIRALFLAADRIPPCCNVPGREHLVPFLFRVLYCSGLRVGEALRLELRDVDVERGILLIREGKFGRDRLIPLSESMRWRLKGYLAVRPSVPPCPYLFPSRHGHVYCHMALYGTFRQLLFACGIGHRGGGKGPRLHDLRHTFAVHRLELWYRQGGNLVDRLPALSAYMGHRSLVGTQRYLRITPALFPNIADRMNAFHGAIIPGRVYP
jgi:integrase